VGAPTSDLQDFFELQMQKKRKENSLISTFETMIFCLKCFEKKTLNLSSLKPHIFFILGPF
jgi:hypothetical protein